MSQNYLSKDELEGSGAITALEGFLGGIGLNVEWLVGKTDEVIAFRAYLTHEEEVVVSREDVPAAVIVHGTTEDSIEVFNHKKDVERGLNGGEDA